MDRELELDATMSFTSSMLHEVPEGLMWRAMRFLQNEEVPECDRPLASSSDIGLLMRTASSPGESCGPADNIMSLWLSATQSASCTCCKGCRCRHGSAGFSQTDGQLTSRAKSSRSAISPGTTLSLP